MVDDISPLVMKHRLGAGAYGVVFMGEDAVHGDVAVKVVGRKPGQTDEQWAVHRRSFLAEAQNLSRATHKNVVQVHKFVESEDGNSIKFCMAYCPGGSLQTAFERGPMTLGAVRKAATEVTLGLQALHARGMIHRDIKPANILLDRRGVAKIGDFGFVTDEIVLGYAQEAGYYDHLAYEVWHGRGTSVKSDIWALGMTLYRLLHGQQWYEEAPAPFFNIEHGGFADSLRWLPHIPKAWRRVLRKMMNDSTRDRYQTTDQLLGAYPALPTTPIWECSVSPGLVRWVQVKGDRRIIVEWTRHSERRHEWKAWSEPIAAGRPRALGGSAGIIGRVQAEAELKAYFGS